MIYYPRLGSTAWMQCAVTPFFGIRRPRLGSISALLRLRVARRRRANDLWRRMRPARLTVLLNRDGTIFSRRPGRNSPPPFDEVEAAQLAMWAPRAP
jgi:hypothetical protein